MKARDLLTQRPTNDIERARLNRNMSAFHDKAVQSELRAQQRAKEQSQ